MEKLIEKVISTVLHALERLGIDIKQHVSSALMDSEKEIEKAVDAAAKRVSEEVKDVVDSIINHLRHDDGGPDIHFPDPTKIIKQIENAASGAINAVNNAASAGVSKVNSAVSAGEAQIKKEASAVASGIESEVEKGLQAILKAVEKGALDKAVSILELAPHTDFQVSLGPIALEWDDVSEHFDELTHLAANPPTDHDGVIAAIKAIKPDSVQITLEVNLFSKDLGGGFQVTFDTDDFLQHAEDILAKL